MFVEPAEVYARAARGRCLDICQEIVDEIRAEPETPDLTGRMKAGYHAIVDGAGALIVNPIEYWHYQEFGTHKMPANPHVRPAIEKIRRRHAI